MVFRVFWLWIIAFTLNVGMAQQVESPYAQQQTALLQQVFIDPAGTRELIRPLLMDRGKVPDSLYARNWNLYGLSFAVQGQADSALFGFDQALSYLRDNHLLKPGILVNKAGVFRSQNRLTEAIECLWQAEKLAENQVNDQALAKVYGEMAAVLNLSNEDKGLHYLDLAIRILERDKVRNRQSIAIERQKLANSYIRRSDFAAAITIYEEILPYFQQQQLLDRYYVSLVNYVDCLIAIGECDKARELAIEAYEGHERLQNQEMICFSGLKIAYAYSCLGKPEVANGWHERIFQVSLSLKSPMRLAYATDYIDHLLVSNRQSRAREKVVQILEEMDLAHYPLKDQVQFYVRAAKAFGTPEHYEVAYDFLSTGMDLRDSLARQEDELKTSILMAQFKLGNLEHNQRLMEEQLVASRRTMILGALIGLVVLLILLYQYRLAQVRNQLKNKEIQGLKAVHSRSEEKILTQEGQMSKHARIIEDQKHELLYTTLANLEMNTRIDAVMEELRVASLDQGQVLDRLRRLKTGENQRSKLVEKVTKIDPHFYADLKRNYPDITRSELEFCALVRMGMSYKEIADFLQISTESVYTKKYRLSQKVGLSREVDFHQWILDQRSPAGDG